MRVWVYNSWAIMQRIAFGLVFWLLTERSPEQSVSSLLGFWNKPSLRQNGLNKHWTPQSCSECEPVQVGQWKRRDGGMTEQRITPRLFINHGESLHNPWPFFSWSQSLHQHLVSTQSRLFILFITAVSSIIKPHWNGPDYLLTVKMF